jgi:hypothetical protein
LVAVGVVIGPQTTPVNQEVLALVEMETHKTSVENQEKLELNQPKQETLVHMDMETLVVKVVEHLETLVVAVAAEQVRQVMELVVLDPKVVGQVEQVDLERQFLVSQ